MISILDFAQDRQNHITLRLQVENELEQMGFQEPEIHDAIESTQSLQLETILNHIGKLTLYHVQRLLSD